MSCNPWKSKRRNQTLINRAQAMTRQIRKEKARNPSLSIPGQVIHRTMVVTKMKTKATRLMQVMDSRKQTLERSRRILKRVLMLQMDPLIGIQAPAIHRTMVVIRQKTPAIRLVQEIVSQKQARNRNHKVLTPAQKMNRTLIQKMDWMQLSRRWLSSWGPTICQKPILETCFRPP